MAGNIHVETLESPTENTLIMLHGWGQSSDALRPLAKLLRTRTQPSLVDLPGFGKSSVPDDIWSAFDYATRIKEHMDAKGIAKCDFLGHSFGGKVAMSMAIKYPERVGKLILISSSGLPRRRTLLEKTRLFAIKTAGFCCKKIDALCKTSFYADKFIPAFGSSDYKTAGGVQRSILVKSVNEDYTPHLNDIKAPTLILWGANDTETPKEMAQRLHHAIAGSKLVIMPDKSHVPFNDVGSHLCAHYITRFLSEE